MKRCFRLTVCFLLCACFLPIPVQAALQATPFGEDIYVEHEAEGLASVNGTFYISYTDYSANGGAVIQNPISSASEFYANQYGMCVITCADDRLLARNGIGVYQLADRKATPLFKDEISLFNTEAIYSSAVVGDMLFLHVADGLMGRLIRMSLLDGNYTTVSNCQAKGIAPGPDQALYVLQKGSSEEFPMEVALYDAQGRWMRTVTGIESAEAYGFACDQTSGDLYWMINSTLYRWRNGETVAMRKLPLDQSRVMETCYARGYYGVRTMDFAVYLFNPELALNQTALVIREMVPESRVPQDGNFMLEHPSIVIIREQKEHYCAEEVFEAIQNGDDTVDIFQVKVTTSLRALMEKGYLVPLDDRPDLTESMKKMYPDFQEALCANGVLYAIPFEVIVRGWDVDAELTDKAEIPATIDDLLDAMEDWEINPLNDGQDLVKDWSAMDLARYILRQYVMEKVSQGEAVTFQEALLKERLARTRGLVDSGALRVTESKDGSDALFRAPKEGAMYYGYTSLDGYSWERNRCIASPGWQEESVGKNEVELSVYVVNPLSNHQEEAIMYLTYETKHWPAYINGKLYADTEPTITTFGMELIAELRQMAEDWRNEIPNEPDEQRRELYAKFAEGYEEQAQRYYDEPSHWAYYAPALEAYRANVVPNLFTQTTRLLEGSDQTHAPVWDELTKAVQQYLEGFTSLDQCVQRLGQIARMLALEE